MFHVDIPEPSSEPTCVVRQDAFDKIDTATWTVLDTAAPVMVSAQGDLLFALAPDQPELYNGIGIAQPPDLSQGGVAVELVQPPNADGFGDVRLVIDISTEYYMVGVFASGAGTPLKTYFASNTGYFDAPYDPVEDRFWRILTIDSADGVELDASSDGETYKQRLFLPTAASFRSVDVYLQGGSWTGGGLGPDTARIDNFQLISTSCAPLPR